MKCYFVYDPNSGFVRFDTAQERDRHHDECLEFYRKDAKESGEWDDEIDWLVSGEITETSKFVPCGGGGDGDYHRASITAPDNIPGQITVFGELITNSEAGKNNGTR